MLITIITPNFNSYPFLSETFESIKSQTHSNWEWLVIDDGSTDRSPELVRKWAGTDDRIKFIQRTNNPKGASTCRNIGIKNAKGVYLLFLDADDILAPHCLKNRLKLLMGNPILDFGVFKMQTFRQTLANKSDIVNKYTSNQEDYLKMFLSYNLPWQTSCPFWKTSFLKTNNIFFSENYQRMQDPEFHCKILLKNKPHFKIFKNEKPDCFYRLNNETKTKNKASLEKTTSSILLFYKEISDLLNKKDHNYNIFMNQFTINIFHSLLFYTRLANIWPVINLYHKMNRTKPIKNISFSTILVFSILNWLRITFVKGAGVSRLWTFLFKA